MKTGNCHRWRLSRLVRTSAWISLLFLGSLANALVEWPVADRAGMALVNDDVNSGNLTATATGDFNGDGKKDLAVVMGNQQVHLFLAELIGSTGAFSSRVNMEILSSVSEILLADMDGDGFDDLIWLWSSEVRVFRGRAVVPSVLNISAADLTLQAATSVSSIAVGDFNADGKKDLVVGEGAFNNAAGRVTLLLGSAPFVTGSYPIASYPGAKVFSGKSNSRLGDNVVSGDVNGDGRDDLVLSASNAGTGQRLQAGEVYVFFQPAALASPINMATASPDITILGPLSVSGARPSMECLAVGDFNGDGDREALILTYPDTPSLIDGLDLPSGSGPHVVDLLAGSTNSVSPVALYPVGTSIGVGDRPVWGDFDGDGALDYFFRDINAVELSVQVGVLSGQRGQLPFALTRPSAMSVQLTPTGQLGSLADINSDGRDDLFYYIPQSAPPFPPYGTLYLFPGTAGLWDPSIVLAQTDEASRRVQATLQVRGLATEMRLSGNILDPDQWVPYGTSRHVALTAEPGPKTVRVTFRGASGVLSETASAPVSLSANETRVRVFTNRIRRGANQGGVWDYTLTAPGNIRARVYDRMGNRVAELVNQSFPSGVVAVEWDGKTSSGQWVAPGAYILVLEANGRSDRLDIVMEP